MGRVAALAGLISAAFLLFYLSARTPGPGADSPAAPGAFCARCALADVAVIGARPHPVGSAADAAVQAYLIERMTALGLSPRVQSADGHIDITFGDETFISNAPVRNLIGILPGRDRTAPALALMAHYDSVPGSPGAADDAAGDAVALDIVRAIRARGTPARDVAVILTDGEEAGLLGAQAFFASDPEAGRIGFVMNFEARGGGGRAHMFETGADDGGAIDLFRRTAAQPDSNAIFPFVYKYLPNNTDFTIARKRGLPGLNFAFIGRQFDYHSPSSTFAALDRGSVRHMGRTALGPAVALALSPRLPPRTPDLVYSDVLGRLIIAYPPAWGWAPIAAAAALVALAAAQASRRERLSPAALVLGAAAAVAILLGGAAILLLARWLTGAGSGWMSYRPLLARFPLFESAMALAALAALLLAIALLGRRAHPASGWIGLLLTGVVAAAGLQALAPLTAFVIAWPLLAASGCAALTAGGWRRTHAAWALYAIAAVVVLAWLGEVFHDLLQGLDIAPACAVFAWLAAFVLWPVARPSQGPPAVLAAAAGCLLVALGICLFLRFSSPWDARHPRAVEPLYVIDEKGAWRASLAPIEPWTSRFLGPARAIRLLPDVPGAPGPLVATPAPLPAEPHPDPLSVSRDQTRAVVMTIAPPGPDGMFLLSLMSKSPAALEIDGASVTALAGTAKRVRVVWQGVTRPLSVKVTPKAAGDLDTSYALWSPGWPPGPPPPPFTPGVMPWDRSASTVITGRRHITD